MNDHRSLRRVRWRQKLLPAAKEGGEPLPEGLLWLLLTGEVRRCYVLLQARMPGSHLLQPCTLSS